jgi:ParB/RepB/Spo0J family partition protein
MSPKVADRIEALRKQRAAALSPEPESTPPESTPPESTPPNGAPSHAHAANAANAANATNATNATNAANDVASIQSHFGGPLGQIAGNRPVLRLAVGRIAPDMRPEMRQTRMLPLPETLLQDGTTAYRHLVEELCGLGQSLRERQIQPIVVYPGSSEQYPAAQYLILVGQRRWTAACLVGMEHIDAVVVDPPTPTERVRIQYSENEDREEFSDMERAWSLLQMKQSLEDAPWEEVETRLQMSRTRRHQLIRLLAFTPEQQQQVALLRLQETQIRSLHTAVRSNELSTPQVDALLERLAEIAAERFSRTSQPDQDDNEPSAAPSRRAGIDGPTVARLVARARRVAQAPEEKQPAPRWLPPLREQIARTSQRLKQSQERIEHLHEEDSAALQADLYQLDAQVREMLNRLASTPGHH